MVSTGRRGPEAARPSIFEYDNFTSPAYVARVDYRGVPGLRVGGSWYFCNNIGANADKPTTYTSYGDIPVRIYTVDARYINRFLTFRGNCIFGNLGKSDKAEPSQPEFRKQQPLYPCRPYRQEKAVSYGTELGLNLQGIAGTPKCPALYPFARYEYYNPRGRSNRPSRSR